MILRAGAGLRAGLDNPLARRAEPAPRWPAADFGRLYAGLG
jgi:hypothetical protein